VQRFTTRSSPAPRSGCKAWNVAIGQPLLLQQKLFLTPFEVPFMKPDLDKMCIESRCVFPAMVQATHESIEPIILHNPLIEPYTNYLRARGEAKKGSWMNKYMCQPPALELPI
jgi:hypothetical protein